MSAEKFLKISYRADGEKTNVYLKMPSQTLSVLKKEIIIRLFNERQLPEIPIRIFWIDEDNDEIELVNQYDYEIFLAQRPVRQHIHVAPVNEAAAPPKANGTAKPDGPTSSAVHFNVECDECNMDPIVGFRYKCIECPNFDLCQKCEAAQKHSGHMMMRMPNSHCPTLGEVYVTGPTDRRSKRHRNRCPFVAQQATMGCATGEPSTENAGESGERHHHHHRRASRKQMRQNLLSNLFAMMNEQAPSSAPTAPDATQDKAAAKAAEAATKMAESAAKAAQEIVSKVNATVMAAAQQAQKPDEAAACKTEDDAAKEKSTGAKPKTSAQTPNAESEKKAESPNGKREVPVLNIPNLEQLAQYIDPQYLSTGMEILNNFAEGFAKMLDPADDGNFKCPFATPEERKDSSASTASSSQASQTSEKPKETEKAQESDAEKKSEQGSATPSNSDVPTAASTPKQPENERPRAQSVEENGWQLIDKQLSNTSLASIDGAGAAAPAAAAAAATAPLLIPEKSTETVAAPSTATVAAPINFEQLGKDLRAHIEAEKQRQEQQPKPKAPEEKRSIPIYHTDERVNKAVHAMMAMGFSNEGAWLTQLLESVNGNIPEALDLLSATQRNNK